MESSGFDILDDDHDQMIRDREILNTQIRGILNSQTIRLEEKGYLLQLLHNLDLRDTLSDILGEINTAHQIMNHECIKLLADIIRYILTIFVHEEIADHKFLYVILEVSQNIFFCTTKKRKVYLTSLLFDHGIWSDLNNWKECIDYMMRLKIEDANRRRKRKEQLDKLKGQNSARSTLSAFVGRNRSGKTQDSNLITKGFKSLRGFLQTKEDKFKEELKLYANMIFNELSRYVAHFINLNLPYEYAHEILLWCCEEFCVDKTQSHILLTELKSNQKNPSKMFTDHEVLVQSLQKRSNRLCKLGFNDMTLIMGCTIKFIDSD